MFLISCDIKTGLVLNELPVTSADSFTRAMMTPTTASFDLPLSAPTCPNDWEALTAPWRVIFAIVDDDGYVWWAGAPTARTWKASTSVVSITCGSLEHYLARRYVPPRRFDQSDQCSQIARWLVESTLDAGIPIELDTPPSGVLRDREYTEDEAGTVLQRLNDLSDVINGPEWWIESQMSSGGPSTLEHIFHTGYPRIGVAAETPRAVFELPGGLIDVTTEERWGESESATYVSVTGEGEGETKPRSRPHVALNQEWDGYPRLERVIQAQNVTVQSTLDSKAAEALARLSEGTSVCTLTQSFSDYPQVKRDWDMGDDVRLIVNTPNVKIDRVLRLIGWKINAAATTVEPIVAGKDERTEDEKGAGA